mgnify:CR=1 FL=1
MTFKQVIVVRNDLSLPKGKLAAQVAHASVLAMRNSSDDVVKEWLREGGKKVVVRCADKAALFQLQHDAKRAGLAASVVKDAGHTVVKPGTVTALGVGPGRNGAVDRVTGSLSLL